MLARHKFYVNSSRPVATKLLPIQTLYRSSEFTTESFGLYIQCNSLAMIDDPSLGTQGAATD
jgi:hypothetical protein